MLEGYERIPLELKMKLKKYLNRLIGISLSPLGRNKLVFYIHILNIIRCIGFESLSQRLLNSFELKGPNFVKTYIKSPLGIKYVYLTNSIDDLRYSCRSNFVEWEFISRNFFASIATDCELILDIGAYTGIYSIESAIQNDNCLVNAFEPNPKIFSNLLNNIERNKLSSRIEPYQIALGRKAGINRIYIPDNSKSTSMLSLASKSSNYFEVTMLTIDDICNKYVGLIKIDVEGYESEVFLGGRYVLDKFKPIILAEALTHRELMDQKLVLSKYGYLDPIQVFSGSKSDRRNYIWFSKKDKSKVNFHLKKSRYDFINRISKNYKYTTNFNFYSL